jgi:LPXTG-motif cell wall-anchored protein
MRRVAPLLLVAGLVLAVAHPATAAPPSSDPKTAAGFAAAWLAHQVNDAGFIPQAANPANANLSVTAQAVPALASAGVGKQHIDALLAYLGQHVDDFVTSAGADDAGSLAYLILAAKAGGADPTVFGTPPTNLVTRLVATQQSNGLFGTADPTFDGAYREGLALLALHAAGVANAAGVTWLEGQQCDNGSWTAFRADTTQPCPAVDPVAFTGPDTNSTALAALGLFGQGETAEAGDGVAALKAVRNAGGGWGFLARADQGTDANSTGLVVEAIRTVDGTADGPGTAALLALQVGCTADAADQGGIAFQPGAGGALAPDALATAQAIAALAQGALPITSATIATGLPTPCPSAPPTTAGIVGSTQPTTTTTAGRSNVAAAQAELPRTGTHTAPITLAGVCAIAAGGACLAGSRRRRA